MKKSLVSAVMLASLSTSVLGAPDSLIQSIVWSGTIPPLSIVGDQAYIKDLSATGLGNATLTFTRDSDGSLMVPTQSVTSFEVLSLANNTPITHTVALTSVSASVNGVSMPTGSWTISRNGAALSSTPTTASTVSSNITITPTVAGLALLEPEVNARVVVTTSLTISAGV